MELKLESWGKMSPRESADNFPNIFINNSQLPSPGSSVEQNNKRRQGSEAEEPRDLKHSQTATKERLPLQIPSFSNLEYNFKKESIGAGVVA